MIVTSSLKPLIVVKAGYLMAEPDTKTHGKNQPITQLFREAGGPTTKRVSYPGGAAYKMGRESPIEFPLSQDPSLPRCAGEADLEERREGIRASPHLPLPRRAAQPAWL